MTSAKTSNSPSPPSSRPGSREGKTLSRGGSRRGSVNSTTPSPRRGSISMSPTKGKEKGNGKGGEKGKEKGKEKEKELTLGKKKHESLESKLDKYSKKKEQELLNRFQRQERIDKAKQLQQRLKGGKGSFLQRGSSSRNTIVTSTAPASTSVGPGIGPSPATSPTPPLAPNESSSVMGVMGCRPNSRPTSICSSVKGGGPNTRAHDMHGSKNFTSMNSKNFKSKSSKNFSSSFRGTGASASEAGTEGEEDSYYPGEGSDNDHEHEKYDEGKEKQLQNEKGKGKDGTDLLRDGDADGKDNTNADGDDIDAMKSAYQHPEYETLVTKRYNAMNSSTHKSSTIKDIPVAIKAGNATRDFMVREKVLQERFQLRAGRLGFVEKVGKQVCRILVLV